MGSVVMALHTTALSPEATLDIVTMAHAHGAYEIEDYGADSWAVGAGDTWETFDQRFISHAAASNTFRASDRSGDPAITIPHLLDTWVILTAVFNPETFEIKLKRNGGSVAFDSAVFGGTRFQWAEHLLRLGYLRSSVSIGGGRHIAVGEIHFFFDDILLNQSAAHASLEASMAVKYGV
jgi:hypothetical protein